MTLRAGGARLLGGLLLFALLAAGAAPLGWDLPEPRSRASKIRVHPRGNLWATGHFMGKKSLEPPSPSLLGTAPHTSLRDQTPRLSHHLLRVLLQKKALGMTLSGPAPHTQISIDCLCEVEKSTALIPPRPFREKAQEAAGANVAEVMLLIRKTRRHG
ncbi:NMB [Cervus elaphus hippelaphus]|uniref:NMB n=1 Tax=Cervus elaphus hippelaphus TaxID=46360 RepID=A0A212CSZ3_CEREH|nr:NMB [Cervus elaphus hippelaphus]